MQRATSVGGVLVRISKGRSEILLIRDLSYEDWFLPKGHQKEGESLQQTALREIEEETGLTDLEIKAYLGGYERYAEASDEMKTEKFFLVRKTGDGEPRIEPGQNWQIRWFGLDELPVFYIEGQERIIRHNLAKIREVS